MNNQLKLTSLLLGLLLLWGCGPAVTETTAVQQTAATNTPVPVEQTAPPTPTAVAPTADEAEQPDPTQPVVETDTVQPQTFTPTLEPTSTPEPPPADTPTPFPATPTEAIAESAETGIAADVLSVGVRGEPGAYTFSVEIASPDTGCDQYADWWEVLSEDGQLLYRRILLHSHVNEQPFSRTGGPVTMAADDVVWVRAHMNTGGYGGQVLKGSPAAGFQPAEAAADFAAGAETLPPLPAGCNF